MTSFAELNGMDEATLRGLLAGPREERVRLLRCAAEGGAVEAQLRLGQMLLDGTEVPRAPADALRWFGAAARAGHPMGMNMVGRCIEHGWGTRADPAQAAAWYRAAADRGLDWGLYNLATLLALGESVAEDRPQAFDLFKRAAAMGHAKSANMVGSFLEDGWATTRDRDAALRWYRVAAEGGDFRGEFNLARCLIEDGRIEDALPWLSQVADIATPRFMAQVCAWLCTQDDPRLRDLGRSRSRDVANASVSH